MTLGNCPARPLGVGFLQIFAPAYLITENGWLITFHGLNALCTAHRLHRRNAAAALLDGGYSGLPPPAQLRARVLFSVFRVVPLLRRAWPVPWTAAPPVACPSPRAPAVTCP